MQIKQLSFLLIPKGLKQESLLEFHFAAPCVASAAAPSFFTWILGSLVATPKMPANRFASNNELSLSIGYLFIPAGVRFLVTTIQALVGADLEQIIAS